MTSHLDDQYNGSRVVGFARHVGFVSLMSVGVKNLNCYKRKEVFWGALGIYRQQRMLKRLFARHVGFTIHFILMSVSMNTTISTSNSF